jgi:hypothetical protein
MRGKGLPRNRPNANMLLASWRSGQFGCKLLLVSRNPPGVVGVHTPSRLAVQCGPDPTPHLGLIVSGRNEDRSESSAVDLIIVRPATRTLMIPVAAERDCHRGTDRGRVGPFDEDDRCLVNVGHYPTFYVRRARFPSPAATFHPKSCQAAGSQPAPANFHVQFRSEVGPPCEAPHKKSWCLQTGILRASCG